MNLYSVMILLFAFGHVLLGFLVWVRRLDIVGWRYFVFCITAAGWGFGISILFNSNVSYDFALFGSRFGNACAIFIPVTWLHFILVFTGNSSYKKLLSFLYIFAFILIGFTFTPVFIPGLAPTLGFKHFTLPGPVYHFHTLIFLTFISFSFVQLMKKIMRSTGPEKVRLIGFFIAATLGFLGGTATFLPVYGIAFPQYGVFAVPIYLFITGYFMMRHHLFDVEEIAQSFQREKLATIGLLAASVNHEIRNPLYAAQNLLEGFIENAKEGNATKNPLEVSEKAKTQIARALDVISKLNRFAKPSTDVSMNSQASIQEAVKVVLDLVSYEFELDKIKINNYLDLNLPPIQADQRQLEEILFNLIVNACHAMKAEQTSGPTGLRPGGETRNEGQGGTLEIRSTNHDSRITIEIKDSGTGIPPEQTKYLFEPFHTTKGDKGTGLGLYITKQLVERNGGKIAVTSRTGNGTTVTISFPIVNGKKDIAREPVNS